MNLLNATLYDPAVAVSKVTTAALAMTALDTTNLRLLFTVPASGKARVKLGAVIHGATTFPSILLGVMSGATVVGRVAPIQVLGNTAVATALVTVIADFVVTGLTPGTATTWDAAYGVETLVAATGLKYGGPNNATANDAFGGFLFEIWDPCPDYTPAANGVPPTTATRTVLPAALVGGRMDSSVGALAAAVITAAAFNAGAIDANAIATDAIGAAELAAGAATKIRDTILSDATTFAGANIALIKAKTDNLPASPAAVGSAMTLTAPYDPAKTASQAGDAMTLTAGERTNIATALMDLAAAVEGLTPRQILRVLTAAMAGKADGLATTTVHYRDVADTKNRITATVDADGNRTAVTLDAT